MSSGLRAVPSDAAPPAGVRTGPWPAAGPIGLAVLFVLLYGAAVFVGRLSRLPGTQLALVWPAAAVGFAWMLWSSYRGRRFLAVNATLLAAVAGLINFSTGARPHFALALGLANVLQALVECGVLARLRPGAWPLRRPADLAAWVVACLAGALAGACIGPAVIAAGNGGDVWQLAGAWTLRNATNTFVFGAVALRVAGAGLASVLPPRHQALELAAATLVLTGAYVVVFGLANGLPLAYLVLPLSMWISLRFSTTIAAAHVLLSAALVLGLTMVGRGPFAATSPATRVLLAQAFVAVVGLVALVLALYRDERQALVLDLRAARVRADQQAHELHLASEAKSQFLATMSHEIRTPLNGVLGFTALLAQTPDDPGARDWAVAADTAGRQLLAIVNNGLDLAKIEAGGVQLEEIEFDLMAVGREALLPSQLTAREAGVDLRLVAGPGLHRDRVGDPVRIRQVLTNLVSNAVKFTARGSVTLALHGTEDAVLLQVIDTGIGMTPEQQDRSFAPFQQATADTTRRYGGTGLGLSIAAGLVAAMGGRIAVTSAPGEGTTFSVELVLARASGQNRPAALAPAPPPEVDLDGLRVLVAEDNLVNQMVARATLQARGLLVDVVGDGDQAVTAALSGRYAAVFMDCQMPTLDGLEATRQIRAAEATAETGHLPVIAMTAGAFAEDRQACMMAGMDDFLPKPWTAEELAGVLTRLARDHLPVRQEA